MKYVALLRGINVGGNNIVKMQELKKVFESLKLAHVSTYINTGNVIFETERIDTDVLVRKIESELEKRFDICLRVVLRSEENIRMLCKHIPEEWKNNSEQKTDVLFLWSEVDTEESLKQIKSNPEVDTLHYVSGAIVWNIKRKNYSKSGMHSFIGTRIYKNMTARNINTVRKIKDLLS